LPVFQGHVRCHLLQLRQFLLFRVGADLTTGLAAGLAAAIAAGLAAASAGFLSFVARDALAAGLVFFYGHVSFQ